MKTNEQILRVLEARDEGFKTQLDYVGNSIGYGRAIQLLGQLWDDKLQAHYPDMSRHQESMHRRTDIERIEAGLPIGRKVVYVPKRARKGVINITCWGPNDAEIPPASRIISDTPLYGQTLAATKPESAAAETVTPNIRVPESAPADAPMLLDPVVEANRALLHERSQFGIKKYGVTLGDAKLSERELIVHALQEALDLSNYLQANLQRVDAQAAAPSQSADQVRDAARLDFILDHQAFIMTLPATSAFPAGYQLMIQDEDEDFVELSGEGIAYHTKREAIDVAMEFATSSAAKGAT